jgi:hypothetical protein
MPIRLALAKDTNFDLITAFIKDQNRSLSCENGALQNRPAKRVKPFQDTQIHLSAYM